MKNKKSNKGITLIALVITIIVMLILVAVTISMAINGGLFGYAGKAAGDMQNEIDKEQQLANGEIQVGNKVYDSIDEYIYGKKEIHNWTRTGDVFTCSHCNAVYVMGQKVNYTATGTSTIYLDRLGFEGVAENEISVTSQETEWIVLGIEDTNNNGTNETLLITSDEPISVNVLDVAPGLPLLEAVAYNNGPDEINRICKELYSNSEYGEARGITIEDVNVALNYTPIGGMYYQDGTLKTTGNLTTKLKDLPTSTWEAIKANGTNTPDGANTEEALGNYELNGYYYYVNEDGTALANPIDGTTSKVTPIERDTIFGSSGNYFYWLASRGVGLKGLRFFLGEVRGFGEYPLIVQSSPYLIEDEASLLCKPVRPVVSMWSKLPSSDEDLAFFSVYASRGMHEEDTLTFPFTRGMTWSEFINSEFNCYGFFAQSSFDQISVGYPDVNRGDDKVLC